MKKILAQIIAFLVITNAMFATAELSSIQPKYPQCCLSTMEEGHVIIQAYLDQNGHLGDLTVVESTNTKFTKSVVAAIHQFKQSDQILAGPREQHIEIPFFFIIKD